MRWRRILQFRILTLMVLMAVFGLLVRENVRPRSRLLGHVMGDLRGPFPEVMGMWVDGHDCG